MNWRLGLIWQQKLTPTGAGGADPKQQQIQQTMMKFMPVMMLFILPAIFAVMPGVELSPGLALVPVVQTVLGFKAPDVWRSEAGLVLLGPGAFDFDFPYNPIEDIV